jgi:rhomboid protease GluP
MEPGVEERPERTAGVAGRPMTYRELEAAMASATPQPVVTWFLIGANALVYLVMCLRGVDPVQPSVEDALAWGASYAPKTAGGAWWRLLTSCFVHFGFVHVALNLWVLSGVGPRAERAFGSIPFGIAYLVSGVAASLASTQVALLSANPPVSAGASGAVFGTFGMLLAWVVRGGPDAVSAHLRYAIGRTTLKYVIVNLVYGLAIRGVDNVAHGGGLVAGFLAGLVLSNALTPRGLAARLPHALRLAAGSALILSGAAWMMRTDDVAAEADRAQDTIDRARAEVARTLDPKDTDALAIAARYEAAMLPPIRDARARIEGLVRVPRVYQPWLDGVRADLAKQERWVLANGKALRDAASHLFGEERDREVRRWVADRRRELSTP